MSDNGRVTAYTTFQPDVPIDMDESEYASLLRQGLIVEKPDGEPVDENAPADLVDQESPEPAPRKRR